MEMHFITRKMTRTLLFCLIAWLVPRPAGQVAEVRTDEVFVLPETADMEWTEAPDTVPVLVMMDDVFGITISKYDSLIQKYSDKIGWDWRLLASMMYQESRFNPDARSPQGAFGVMQMMPVTGAKYGIDTTATVEQQIAAGVRYLAYLNKLFSDRVSDEQERIKFILASYNVGPGHIFDAVRLADRMGKQPMVWDNNVDSCLLDKSLPEYYTLPEARNGYCRGKEAFTYVRDVIQRFEGYKQRSMKQL